MKSIIERGKAETPKFFKNVIKIGLVLGAIGGTLLTAGSAIPALVTIGTIMTAVGGTAAAVAKVVDGSKGEE